MVTASDISDDDLDLAGELALDFVNTVVPTARGGAFDFLDQPTSFAAWTERAAGPVLLHLVPRLLPERRTLTLEARTLRDAIVELFRSASAETTPPSDAVFVVDRALRAGRISNRVRALPGGLALDTTYEARGPLAPLAPIARAAVELLEGADPTRLRPCAAPDCVRWFLDTSKGGRRRWCSMARCGNRAKAARYRERHSTGE